METKKYELVSEFKSHFKLTYYILMAENDIYNHKKHYENLVNNLNRLLVKSKSYKASYYCVNKVNLKYFQKLFHKFELDDLSYIRRLAILRLLKILVSFIDYDLKNITQEDMDKIVLHIRKTHNPTIATRNGQDMKMIARWLFGEDNLPAPFKTLKIRNDTSKERGKKDKLTYGEYDKLINFFNNDATIKAYLTIGWETLARPQELLYIKLSGCEINDNYAIIYINEHGKEGTKKLLCIDSYEYLINLYKVHKNINDKESYLFLNNNGRQLTPFAINKRLRTACKQLGLDKPITCYSIKRFGVTYRRLRGDPDNVIQKIAGWTSTKQIRVYDHSDQDDVFRRELARRGLIKDDKYKDLVPEAKNCQYCGDRIGFAEKICPKCKHILDRDLIKERIEKDQELIEFIKGIEKLKESNPEVFQIIKDIGVKIKNEELKK